MRFGTEQQAPHEGVRGPPLRRVLEVAAEPARFAFRVHLVALDEMDLGRDGRQYVEISAGGHGVQIGPPLGDYVVTFALPKGASAN